ncbi:MAG: LacI family DNA-binding transcriptional regulator, partial [Akkermansiaceae bacterium]|nr:LacI family DNA-binding transcriptional regulator [Armatimonadota bacterium]
YVLAVNANPPLTTIHHPLADVGRKATQLLLARIENEEVEDERCIFEPQLVVRESTAPPPDS